MLSLCCNGSSQEPIALTFTAALEFFNFEI